jgi:archaellum biogenesis protein FlaJ (TadC family)
MAYTEYTDVWWHRPWIKATESVLGHIAAVIIGFIMMVIGLGLGVTIIMLPVGLVIGLAGVAMFIGGLFARIDQNT